MVLIVLCGLNGQNNDDDGQNKDYRCLIKGLRSYEQRKWGPNA